MDEDRPKRLRRSSRNDTRTSRSSGYGDGGGSQNPDPRNAAPSQPPPPVPEESTASLPISFADKSPGHTSRDETSVVMISSHDGVESGVGTCSNKSSSPILGSGSEASVRKRHPKVSPGAAQSVMLHPDAAKNIGEIGSKSADHVMGSAEVRSQTESQSGSLCSNQIRDVCCSLRNLNCWSKCITKRCLPIRVTSRP